MVLTKAALGLGTLVLAGAYTFHEGVIRVDVDQFRSGSSHVHIWVPAAPGPMARHMGPGRSRARGHAFRSCLAHAAPLRTRARRSAYSPCRPQRTKKVFRRRFR